MTTAHLLTSCQLNQYTSLETRKYKLLHTTVPITQHRPQSWPHRKGQSLDRRTVASNDNFLKSPILRRYRHNTTSYSVNSSITFKIHYPNSQQRGPRQQHQAIISTAMIVASVHLSNKLPPLGWIAPRSTADTYRFSHHSHSLHRPHISCWDLIQDALSCPLQPPQLK